MKLSDSTLTIYSDSSLNNTISLSYGEDKTAYIIKIESMARIINNKDDNFIVHLFVDQQVYHQVSSCTLL